MPDQYADARPDRDGPRHAARHVKPDAVIDAEPDPYPEFDAFADLDSPADADAEPDFAALRKLNRDRYGSGDTAEQRYRPDGS